MASASCQESPAFQLHNQYYHCVLFLAAEYISSHVILPKPTLMSKATAIAPDKLLAWDPEVAAGAFGSVALCSNHLCILAHRQESADRSSVALTMCSTFLQQEWRAAANTLFRQLHPISST
ncbi:hypothetical protein Anapl_17739 [Anas platyrhynchos]|uniref:Uncharacterized protein n=1 Tax=Anas platyrhynchos TaxID=8839 RepID=R0KYX8_ANAPL|nr:hypothetical protein Anapl_17739 [Anas platyrhynchos]